MRRILLLASLSALFAAPVYAGLLNGSFEPAGAVAGPAAIPGWRASARGVTWVGASGEDLVAPNGEFVVKLGSDAGGAGRIEQAFPTTPGERYDVAFWLGSRSDGSGGGRVALRVEVAGTTRAVAIDNSSASVLWQAHVFRFTATSAVTTLSFRGEPRRRASAAYLDGVAVRPASIAPVSARDSR